MTEQPACIKHCNCDECEKEKSEAHEKIVSKMISGSIDE